MIKSLVIAAAMTAFAGASFAQAASAPMSSDKPMAAASGSMGKHHAKKMHKSKASSSMGATSAGMK